MITFVSFLPKTAMIAMARRMEGKDIMASMTRIRGLSRRLKKPARAPITSPIMVVRRTTRVATRKDILAP